MKKPHPAFEMPGPSIAGRSSFDRREPYWDALRRGPCAWWSAMLTGCRRSWRRRSRACGALRIRALACYPLAVSCCRFGGKWADATGSGGNMDDTQDLVARIGHRLAGMMGRPWSDTQATLMT